MVVLGNYTFSLWIKSPTKIPKRVGFNLFPSDTPRRMLTLLPWGISGCRTRTLTVWNHSLKCFHILPTIFSLQSSERSLTWWMFGNAVEKSQNTTYFARPFCFMLNWMMERRQYITLWICWSERVPSWFSLCQRTMGFCKFSQPRNKDSLKHFNQCAT